jgi:signal transduction histidine kinase
VRSRWTQRHQARADVILALAIAAVAVVEALTRRTLAGGIGGSAHVVGPRGIVAAAYATAGVALVWRRRSPLAALVAVMAALGLVFAAFGTSEGFGSLAPLLVALYSVGAHRERRVAAGALALFAGFWLLVELRDPLNRDLHDALGSWPVFALGVIVWLAGAYLRTRRLYLVEHLRVATAKERTRIARELHDVVAHAMSVMVIQAEAADEVLDRDHERARTALRQIQRTGRDGLTEMRRLLAVLRQDESPALAPPHGIQALRPLVDDVRATGLPVELTISGDPRAVSSGVDISAYRIVQEALTNAMRHAGASAVSVRLRYGDSLELEVLDDGNGRSPSGTDGHGLLGMRERVALYGGTLDAGPAHGGGFRVRATLPIEADA